MSTKPAREDAPLPSANGTASADRQMKSTYLLRVLLAALIVVLVVIAFFLGRSTAPGAQGNDQAGTYVSAGKTTPTPRTTPRKGRAHRAARKVKFWLILFLKPG